MLHTVAITGGAEIVGVVDYNRFHFVFLESGNESAGCVRGRERITWPAEKLLTLQKKFCFMDLFK
jgi:hypothetical protein